MRPSCMPASQALLRPRDQKKKPELIDTWLPRSEATIHRLALLDNVHGRCQRHSARSFVAAAATDHQMASFEAASWTRIHERKFCLRTAYARLTRYLRACSRNFWPKYKFTAMRCNECENCDATCLLIAGKPLTTTQLQKQNSIR